jgi:hypothetical protein
MKSRSRAMRSKTRPHEQRFPIISMSIVFFALMAILVAACANNSITIGKSGSDVAPTFPPDFLHQPYKPTPNPKGPIMPVMGVPAVKPGPDGMVTKDAVKAYASSHPIPLGSSLQPFQITKVEVLTIAQIGQILTEDPTGDCMGQPAVYVEFSGKFAFPGNPSKPVTYPNAFEIYCLDSGNIVQEGGLGKPTSALPDATVTPMPMPTMTSHPTATPIPPTQPPNPIFKFNVSPTSFKQTCTTNSTFLPVITVNLDNTHSNTGVNWKATVTEQEGGQSWAVPFATTGSVAAGQSSMLAISPQVSLCNNIPGNRVTNLHVVITMTNGPGTAFTITDAVTGPPVIG